MNPKKVKWDESDFTFQLEDRTASKDREWKVVNGRVVDVPQRSKSLKVGEHTISVALCFHSKPIKAVCPTCEWEAPRLERAT